MLKAMVSNLFRATLLIALIIVGIFVERLGLVDYVLDPVVCSNILSLSIQHLQLVALSMFLAIPTGLGLGIVLTRKNFIRFSGPAIYVIGLGQTIPSLAVIALSMSAFGIGIQTAVFALFIYSILPIARNTLEGIQSVRPSLLDAAKGMGMSGIRTLVEVEIPNAMGIIITGCRIALAINIGTATLSFLIGAGGLGDLIFSGISLMDTRQLLAGAIPVALMALAGDFVCEIAQATLVSPGLKSKT